ncbi:hypothetical protein [Saccharopolyspora taberi]|uniref:PH domain-containing protein n=1 Tax=Saccharopolyspora taberi TaxID=60895 RepID=A0ABN3VBG9_9PSEU
MWLSAPAPVLILLIGAVWHSGFVALTYWFVWVIVAAVFAFTVYVGRATVVTAGSDWVRCNGAAVRTYELISIRYAARGMGGVDLVLTDRTGSVVIPLSHLQANKRLWGYVYLGMRYSAANGAKLDRTTRAQFPELVSDE